VSDSAPLDEVLMTLLVEQLYFLEHTPASELDPTLAERMTSEIAFQLSRVPPAELQPFVEFVRRQAEASAWAAERDFLKALPGHLGWTATETTPPATGAS
jgi:hypothetical protein